MRAFNLPKDAKIFAYAEPVRMSKSFRGLSAIVESELKKRPDTGDLFVFANKKATYMKVIWYFKGGYNMFAKKLERGTFSLLEGKIQLSDLQHMVDEIVIPHTGRKRKLQVVKNAA